MARRIRMPDDGKKKGVDLSAAEIPFGVMGKSAHIEMFGNTRFALDGHFSVLEYSDQQIKLRVYKGTVTILGTGLLIHSVAEGEVTITGSISSIEFSM